MQQDELRCPPACPALTPAHKPRLRPAAVRSTVLRRHATSILPGLPGTAPPRSRFPLRRVAPPYTATPRAYGIHKRRYRRTPLRPRAPGGTPAAVPTPEFALSAASTNPP